MAVTGASLKIFPVSSKTYSLKENKYLALTKNIGVPTFYLARANKIINVEADILRPFLKYIAENAYQHQSFEQYKTRGKNL